MAGSQGKFYGMLGLILILGAGAIGYVVLRGDRGVTVDTAASVPASYGEDELVGEDVGVARGSEDAPVVIHEYADYQCPACGMVGTLTIPQILRDYVDTGKVRFIFFDFPLHPGASQLGAQAARCAAEQNAYWPMQKVLLGRQREWGVKRDPRGMFRQYAEVLGLDGKVLASCVSSKKYEDVVMASQMRARQLGINSTPTFFINGRMVSGAMGYDQMAALIDEALAKSESP